MRRKRRRYKREGWTRKHGGSEPKEREDKKKHLKAKTSQFEMAGLFVPLGQILCLKFIQYVFYILNIIRLIHFKGHSFFVALSCETH